MVFGWWWGDAYQTQMDVGEQVTHKGKIIYKSVYNEYINIINLLFIDLLWIKVN